MPRVVSSLWLIVRHSLVHLFRHSLGDSALLCVSTRVPVLIAQSGLPGLPTILDDVELRSRERARRDGSICLFVLLVFCRGQRPNDFDKCSTQHSRATTNTSPTCFCTTTPIEQYLTDRHQSLAPGAVSCPIPGSTATQSKRIQTTYTLCRLPLCSQRRPSSLSLSPSLSLRARQHNERLRRMLTFCKTTQSDTVQIKRGGNCSKRTAFLLSFDADPFVLTDAIRYFSHRTVG